MTPIRARLSGSRPGRPDLRPESDVASDDAGWRACSTEPWLALQSVDVAAMAGRLVEIIYRASLWDEPSRPVFRFWRQDGFVDCIGAAPIVGAGVWLGRVPQGTKRISVSPTNRPGPFGFAIERMRTIWWPRAMLRGLAANPRSTRGALLTRLIGWAPESDVNLAWAVGATPLQRYSAWAATRARAVDLDGLDRPRCDGVSARPVWIVVRGGATQDLATTITSLEAQVFVRWAAVVIDPPDGFVPEDPRVEVDVAGLTSERFGDDLVVSLPAGDRLASFALAYVVEQANRHPEARLFYGDRLERSNNGTIVPTLTPGWSPRLMAEGSGIPAPVFVRKLASFPRASRKNYLETGSFPTAPLTGPDVMALRRLLVETGPAAPCPARAPAPVAPGPWHVTIIIPTRDHPALLRRVVESIRRHSRPDSYRLILVDNGSVTPEAQSMLAELSAAADATRLDHPGPFDFSAMCNAAAASSRSDVLLFLNDDTLVLHDGWLDRLASHAMTADIGAVGAKLTFPDGRIQHIGVTVGMGGSAGHFGALDPPDAPGWAGRSLALHEVSAVTGACLAVAREKFEAVGGFDAENLPVELSDIDLCLKLNARGWQTLIDPAAHLMHEESASRGGATFRRLDVYDRQRAVFVARWGHVLRDDPFFHPGLSLYSFKPALG